MKTILLLAGMLALCGCAHKAYIVRVPQSQAIPTGKAIDARKVVPSFFIQQGQVIAATKTAKPHPKQSHILSNLTDMVLVLDTDRSAAETIAAMVEERLPGANVTIVDLRSTWMAGIFMNDCDVFITVDIERGGKTKRVSAHGSNIWSRPIVENFERAYERAFDDFRRNLRALEPFPPAAASVSAVTG